MRSVVLHDGWLGRVGYHRQAKRDEIVVVFLSLFYGGDLSESISNKRTVYERFTCKGFKIRCGSQILGLDFFFVTNSRRSFFSALEVFEGVLLEGFGVSGV